MYFFFFFSSRRRHTRCSRDWSSDVCSSDLLISQTSRELFSLISLLWFSLFLLLEAADGVGKRSQREHREGRRFDRYVARLADADGTETKEVHLPSDGVGKRRGAEPRRQWLKRIEDRTGK